MKSYLVTGGCGFIGVNLVSRLAGLGAGVRILDNLSLGKREDVAPLGIDLRVGDIRDMAALKDACQGMDVVVHLAAHTRVVESISHPELNFEINAIGTMNVLRACRDAGVKRVIFAPQVERFSANRCLRCTKVWSATRFSLRSQQASRRSLLLGFLRFLRLEYRSSSFFQCLRSVSYHKGSVVAQFFRNFMQKEPLVIYGDGQQTRDFLYVGRSRGCCLACGQIRNAQAKCSRSPLAAKHLSRTCSPP